MRRALLWGLILCAGLASAGWARDSAAREMRSALIIGNADYPEARLRTPRQDAGALAARLAKLGFKVDLVEDANQTTLVNAFRRFLARAENNQVRLVFFAGHGVQWRGRNYLLPIDLEVRREEDLAQGAIDITEVVERLGELKGGVNLVILDACRDSPFNATVTQLADARRVRTRGMAALAEDTKANGFAPVRAPTGTLVAFSTAPGALASDGGGQRHSVYARHLLAQLNRPEQPIERLFKQVRIGVAHETQLSQVPWESSSLMGEFCFRPNPRGACVD